MLRFAEEIILLLLNDDNGRFVHVPDYSLKYALAGGVLMDLAMEDRIDTDLERLILVDATPVGDSLLDQTLDEIKTGGEHNTRFWLERTTQHAEAIRDEALSRLIALSILERKENRFLWVFQSRRYPTIDGEAEREVKLRIMGVLFSDEIPHPRDVVIICLADACGIFKEMLSGRELAKASARIEEVRKLDLIGQTISKAIQDIQISIADALVLHGH